MKHWMVAGLVVATGIVGSSAFASDMRCGWLQNPTPANWWLEDKDASWTIRTQGEASEPEGMDLIPDLSEGEFVKTNGNYGYACACMKVDTSHKDTITRILSVKQLKLSQCGNDKSLKQPG